MSTFVTEDGGLTSAGYGLGVVIALIALAAAVILTKNVTNSKKVSAKQLAFCGVSIALAFVASYIKLFKLPFGGSVTLFSMLFITLIGYWYGVGTGILAGFVYGIMQFLQEPYYLTFFQVCCDYLFAFAALGLSGLFRDKKNGLSIGYIVSVIGRWVFASLAGYLFWMSYMPDDFPKSLAPVYPIVYNFCYLALEAVVTVIFINIPAVKKALAQVKAMALS